MIQFLLFGLNTVDYVIAGFSLLVVLAIGVYFHRDQRSAAEYLDAGRSTSWIPLGLSVIATIVTTQWLVYIPGISYFQGWRLLALPAMVWLALPIMLALVLPMYHRLNITSVYAYLEMRFDRRTMHLAGHMYVLLRLVWIGIALSGAAWAFSWTTGVNVPIWLVVLFLGLLTTAYTYLGGMKGVIWSDVIQIVVVLAGIGLLIGAVVSQLDNGTSDVNKSAEALRARATPDFSLRGEWSIWALGAYCAALSLFIFIADQVTAQRFLAARSLRDARRSIALGCVGVSVIVPLLTYAGLSLLSFYQHDANRLKPRWVVNVDGNGQAFEDAATHRPLLDWDQPIDSETIDKLVAEGRIIDPIRAKPYKNSFSLVDAKQDIVIERLALRRPDTHEYIVNRLAAPEFLPSFARRYAPLGIGGLLLAALLAASLSTVDSGLNSIATMWVGHYEAGGWASRYLARLCGQDAASEVDKLRLARRSVLILGGLGMGLAILADSRPGRFELLLFVINGCGGPIAGIFLLGLLSRRATALAAQISLLVCAAVASLLTAAPLIDTGIWQYHLGPYWPLPVALAGTLGLGYTLSLCGVGQRKPIERLRGLVAGIGRPGDREMPEADIVIGDAFEDTGPQTRWR